jgi:hypothetical protein
LTIATSFRVGAITRDQIGSGIRLATDRDWGMAANITRNHVHASNQSTWNSGALHMLKNLWNDETGVIISAELILVLTIAVLSMVVGLTEVAVAVNTELNDLSNAFGALNQSFAFSGFEACSYGKMKSFFAGSCFQDSIDDCDINSTCDLVTGISTPENGGKNDNGGGHHHNK